MSPRWDTSAHLIGSKSQYWFASDYPLTVIIGIFIILFGLEDGIVRNHQCLDNKDMLISLSPSWRRTFLFSFSWTVTWSEPISVIFPRMNPCSLSRIQTGLLLLSVAILRCGMISRKTRGYSSLPQVESKHIISIIITYPSIGWK